MRIQQLLAAALFFFIVVSPAMAGEKVTVLASLDVVQALGEALTKNTSIEVVNVIPKGYSMQGQDAYFKKHQKTVFEAAARADAVLSVGSAWSADPLYKWARRGNVRIVNIDVTKPLDDYGAGVPLVEVDGEYSPYVWRSPANLTRMASIAADDLVRLVPAEAKAIKANLKAFQTALFKLRSSYEGAFLELDVVNLAALTSGFSYLTDEFGLDVSFYVLTPEDQWTDKDVADIATQLEKNMIQGVVCAWEPDAMGRKAIAGCGAIPVILKRYVRTPGGDPVASLVKWYQGNLSRLLNALKN